MVVFALVSLPAAADLFSPGELAKAHAHLEGLKNCTQCHGDGQKVAQAKCLSCHGELEDRVKANDGFHGRLPELTCDKCHHDHQGKSFELIQWVPSRQGFAHAKTGWKLEGKHQSARCEACHQKRRIKETKVLLLLDKHPKKETYLGLPTQCSGCHFDEHRGQFKDGCDKCHNASGWKPAADFDHQKTRYALTGKHRKVDCSKCHAKLEDESTAPEVFPEPRARSYLKFSPLVFGRCDDCHQDPHEGKLGDRCESCHTTADWHRVVSTGQSRSFHQKTRYPLEGAHVDVDCKACHGPTPGRRARFKNLAYGKCTDCHLDAHLGQLTAKPGEPPCVGCHSVQGFLPARFELARHQETRYPLEAAHRAVACIECHPRDPSLARKIDRALKKTLLGQKRKELFSFMSFERRGNTFGCGDCHKDPHAGQFEQKVKERGCQACHGQESFKQITFDHRVDSRFSLEGKHLKARCESCHLVEKTRAGPVVRYRPLPVACGNCHADVHAAQFAKQGVTACEKCHRPMEWKQLLFEHKPPFTPYLLEGKHAQAKCEGCHVEVAVGGRKVRRYIALPTSCEACHEDFHKGSFRGFSP